MEEIPRGTSLAPLASPCFLLCSMGVETEGLSDYQGRAGIIPFYGGTFARSYSVSILFLVFSVYQYHCSQIHYRLFFFRGPECLILITVTVAVFYSQEFISGNAVHG